MSTDTTCPIPFSLLNSSRATCELSYLLSLIDNSKDLVLIFKGFLLVISLWSNNNRGV